MMAAQGTPEATKPLAREIALYTEEELDRYLEENGRVVSVQDPENISTEFIQRLRDIMQRESEAAKSHAVDLDQVTARLQQVPADNVRRSRSHSPATTASEPPTEVADQEELQTEIAAYHTLIKAGGRSPYPFHLLEDFFWNAKQYLKHEEYGDIVSFWRHYSGEADRTTSMCACQVNRWRQFRNIQHRIRERSVESEWTLFDSAFYDDWEKYVERHDPSEGQWAFPEYEDSLRKRLTKHGFTRPFELHRDVNQQDKLTTWIEYLNYEYRFLDQKESCMKRLQRRYDAAGDKLLESGILKPGETWDMISDYDNLVRYASQQDAAKKALDRATRAVSLAERDIADPQARGRILYSRRFASVSALDTAKTEYEALKKRSDVMTKYNHETRSYLILKDEADRHRILLRWVEQQIPVIELEQSSKDNATVQPGQENGSKSLKRARSHEFDEGQHPQENGSKRLKRARSHEFDEGQHRQENKHGARKSRSASSKARPLTSRKCSKPNSSNGEGSSKRVKSSNAADDSTPPDASTLATSALTPGIRATQDSEDCKGSLEETLQAIKPLRRSARIAEKRKKESSSAGGNSRLAAANPQGVLKKSRAVRRAPKRGPRSRS